MSLRLLILGVFPEGVSAHLPPIVGGLDLELQGEPSLSTEAARRQLDAGVPDLAVIGARFTDGSAFDFLRALPPSQRPVGLVCIGTAEEEAVAAFELQVTDFVLWPAAPERLQEALTRARQQVLQSALLRTADELQRLLGEAAAAGGIDFSHLGGRTAEAGDTGAAVTGRARRRLGAQHTGTLIATAPWRSASTRDARVVRPRDVSQEGVLDLSQEDGGRGVGEARPLRVLVREGRRTRFVPLADVDWFEADGNYIRVHAGTEAYRTRGTITAIEAALDPRQFVRIHRRIVVNMDRVREMSPLPGGDGLLVLGDGSTLRLSRTYRSRVR